MQLDAQSISCTRGDVTVLSNVSFTLAPGACLILRGPNGIGKSTLLRVLAGLSQPSQGSVTINPDDMVYSGHLDAIKLQLTARENLDFWAGVYGIASTAHVIEHFDLGQFADRPVATLSAGQKRRVGLARLTLSGRKIWLMDEPTTSLDAEHRAKVAANITAHCADGGIAVLSTHLDLDIPNAQTLDLAQFVPQETAASLFLEGDY
jgi:heme exporter protein A